MNVPVSLGNFQWICCNLDNRISTAAGNGISRYVSNKVVLSDLIVANYGGSVQGNGASKLEPGSILADTYESGCLTHIRTTFVSVCLKKLIVRFSVLDISCNFITLDTSETG